MSVAGRALSRRSFLASQPSLKPTDWICSSCQRARPSARFSTSGRAKQEQRDKPFGTRLRTALRNTKVDWKPIPIALGIGFLGAVQFYRVRNREKRRQQEEEDARDVEEPHNSDKEHQGRPKKRKRIRPSGPW